MSRERDYVRLRSLDGSHPYRDAVPDGFVLYDARRVRGSRVAYFNFDLAREMGILSPSHPARMTARLEAALVRTFSLSIVNEHDLERGRRIPARDRLPGRYMATRYLQMQHPGRRGLTSGDGRSIWNGVVRHRGVMWDVTSCGTGVTRLCPATALEGRFFATGNWLSDYGCGTASIEEGLAAALMSETFWRNGIATERVLAVLELPNGFAITVRAGRNLLRPSHLFIWLKQGNRERLRAAADYLIQRQLAQQRLRRAGRRSGYGQLAEHVATTFARAAATFESRYVFCWLDWDGDNILADGGIIDYGSVRQFGLYHREYRFDDGPRWSTTLPEQRRKARAIVQCFAQIRDYLITGRRRPLRSFAHDPVLARFDREFARTKDRLLLGDMGFRPETVRRLVTARRLVGEFRRAHGYFERCRTARGPRRVEDGISWNAVFSTRDMLRELPARVLARGGPLTAAEILSSGYSTYASERDRRPTEHRRRMAEWFQRSYLALVQRAARDARRSIPNMLAEIARRSAVLNRFDRITGDSVVYAADILTRDRRRLGPDGLWAILDRFVHYQTLVPELRASGAPRPLRRSARRALDEILGILAECRHGL